MCVCSPNWPPGRYASPEGAAAKALSALDIERPSDCALTHWRQGEVKVSHGLQSPQVSQPLIRQPVHP
jgi:hypothetical protein